MQQLSQTHDKVVPVGLKGMVDFRLKYDSGPKSINRVEQVPTDPWVD